LRVLVVGGGGREHALAWQFARFHHEVFCTPGNAGIARIARCEEIGGSDFGRLAEFCTKHRIDLTVVGPEVPLVAGIADDFKRRGLRVFGPGADGARLEGDKAFAKTLMQEAGIPTAEFAAFDDVDKARAWLGTRPVPVVVKAAGLAAGKGVVICGTRQQAEKTLVDMMVEGRFGDAGRTVVIEECLVGEEASIIGLTDGSVVRFLAPSQDHKRLRDNDEGPNTGGMGAYAPASVVTAEVMAAVEKQVFTPLLAAFRRRGIDYRGVIYAGLMLTDRGLKVLEFNCRFGDPETQVILPLLEQDLAELAVACVEGHLATCEPVRSSRAALCVVAAADGYPEAYKKGLSIDGDLAGADDVVIFHAGTRSAEGRVVTNGGRVLGVTGLGDDLARARDRAYAAVERIRFPGMFFRKDIGARGLARLGH
jgi:phosphoribosylamine--glycine ligase